MEKSKIIYKNHFGDFNILITESVSSKNQEHHNSIACTREYYDAHVWVHDNIVKKNHTHSDLFPLNSFLDDDYLEEVFTHE